MAVIITDGTTQSRVDLVKGLRTTTVPRGNAYAVTNVTGTIGAALAANSAVFAMRLDPGSGVLAFVERIRLQYTTIVAYTTPITAGRRLGLYRGSGAAASGGTAIATVHKKDSTSAGSECEAAQGGDIRISTTGALTVTGITWEADPIRTILLVHVGAAGGYYEAVMEFHASECAPIILQPGQLLGVRNPQAMDAAGTWQLDLSIDWHEAVSYVT